MTWWPLWVKERPNCLPMELLSGRRWRLYRSKQKAVVFTLNYAIHAWHNSIDVWLLDQSSYSPATIKELHGLPFLTDRQLLMILGPDSVNFLGVPVGAVRICDCSNVSSSLSWPFWPTDRRWKSGTIDRILPPRKRRPRFSTKSHWSIARPVWPAPLWERSGMTTTWRWSTSEWSSNRNNQWSENRDNEKRMKINKKRPGLAHFLSQIFSSVRLCVLKDLNNIYIKQVWADQRGNRHCQVLRSVEPGQSVCSLVRRCDVRAVAIHSHVVNHHAAEKEPEL